MTLCNLIIIMCRLKGAKLFAREANSAPPHTNNPHSVPLGSSGAEWYSDLVHQLSNDVMLCSSMQA